MALGFEEMNINSTRRKLEKLSTSYCVSVISTHFKASTTKSLLYLLGVIKSSLVLLILNLCKATQITIISLADQKSLLVQPYTQKHKLRYSFQKCLHFWYGIGKKISHLKSTAIILNILSIKVKHTQQNTKKR